MNNKLQYWIELNPVKLFNKINRTNVTPEQIQVHCGNICYWTLANLKKSVYLFCIIPCFRMNQN